MEKNSNKVVNLLNCETQQEDEWFQIFEGLDDNLVQSLVLIACLHTQDII